MSEKTPHRRPATFKLDDPGVVVMDPDETGRPARGTVRITPESDPSLLPVPIDAPLRAGTPRLSLGHAVLGGGRRAGAARHRAWASSTWSRICSRAAKASASLGLAFAVAADAGADRS